MKRIILFLILIQLITLSMPAQSVSDGVNTAFLEFENINMDPGLDYLGGIIKGLLLYDISRNEYIKMINKTELDDVLEEQHLRLSGLTDDNAGALKVGKILGAHWLIKGEYIYLGRDVLITIYLSEVETGQTYTFGDRGSSENTIHGLAEKVVMKLTGMEMEFQNENSVRSIISMKDESPGIVKLYSWVPGAEIYLDDKFIGYTGEDNKVPYIIEKIEPGDHVIRTDYSSFGEVDLPEMIFHNWDEEFTITNGEEIVLRANQRQFNSIIYDLQQLIREDHRFNNEGDKVFNDSLTVTWQDMNAVEHEIIYTIKALLEDEKFSGGITMNYDGEDYNWAFNSSLDENIDFTEIVRDVDVRFTYSRKRIDYSIWRKDIEQGMWQNQ
ncbi:MAG: hypothetical protein PF518_12275 [Spirochaetaceae bacterium]|jgi:hypothetical protein|nr:hypothetical protein [Spirochaetaceae bacterium]